MTALIPVSQDARVSVDSMKHLTAGKEYLPSIRLMSGSSKKVKKGELAADRYYLARSSSNFQEIGRSFSAVIVASAVKGMMVDRKPPISIYPTEFDSDGMPTDQAFLDIMEDAKIPNSGAVFGYELLMWLPLLGEFALFFCSGASTRRLYKDMLSQCMGDHVIWDCEVAENDKGIWLTPIVKVSPDTSIALPTEKQRLEAERVFKLTIEGGGAEEEDLEESTTPNRAR